eukprot:1155320-Pelagomonas_calceolata.AAC.3
MSEQGGEQQQQQRPPLPPRGDFQLRFHRFLKKEPEDPKAKEERAKQHDASLFEWKHMVATQTTVKIRLLVDLCGLKALLAVRKRAYMKIVSSVRGAYVMRM